MQGGAHGFTMNMISEHALPQLMCPSQLPPSSEVLLFPPPPRPGPGSGVNAARMASAIWSQISKTFWE